MERTLDLLALSATISIMLPHLKPLIVGDVLPMADYAHPSPFYYATV